MQDAELQSLLFPLSDDAPCGADLAYDPAFLALQEAAAGKPELQYGDTVIPAQAPDWAAVHAQALQLAARTRDVRIAVWLIRSGARVGGIVDAVRGLQWLQGLLANRWDQVHPQLDASDNNDPTERMSALSPLVHADAVLADLRAASLNGQRGMLDVRTVELAFGHAEPLPGEPVPTAQGVLQALRATLVEMPSLLARLQAGAQAVKAIGDVLAERVEASASPELAPLARLMSCLAAAAEGAAAGDAGAVGDGLAERLAPLAVRSSGGAGVRIGNEAIASRDDAIRMLDRVADWIERNEPSHPAPLLIRRSQRLMSKGFIDIIRDLAPDGLTQVEKLAGTGPS